MIHPDDVTACLVTRGNVSMKPIVEPLMFDRVIIYNNAKRVDRAVYGRYLAAQEAQTEWVYFQDDDVTVPEKTQRRLLCEARRNEYVCNHPPDHNQQFFPGLHFVGWGTICERDAPERAFRRWHEAGYGQEGHSFDVVGCDIVFSLLTLHRAFDLGQRNMDYAFGEDRVHRETAFEQNKRDYYEDAWMVAHQETVTA